MEILKTSQQKIQSESETKEKKTKEEVNSDEPEDDVSVSLFNFDFLEILHFGAIKSHVGQSLHLWPMTKYHLEIYFNMFLMMHQCFVNYNSITNSITKT